MKERNNDNLIYIKSFMESFSGEYFWGDWGTVYQVAYWFVVEIINRRQGRERGERMKGEKQKEYALCMYVRVRESFFLICFYFFIFFWFLFIISLKIPTGVPSIKSHTGLLSK